MKLTKGSKLIQWAVCIWRVCVSVLCVALCVFLCLIPAISLFVCQTVGHRILSVLCPQRRSVDQAICCSVASLPHCAPPPPPPPPPPLSPPLHHFNPDMRMTLTWFSSPTSSRMTWCHVPPTEKSLGWRIPGFYILSKHYYEITMVQYDDDLLQKWV